MARFERGHREHPRPRSKVEPPGRDGVHLVGRHSCAWAVGRKRALGALAHLTRLVDPPSQIRHDGLSQFSCFRNVWLPMIWYGP